MTIHQFRRIRRWYGPALVVGALIAAMTASVPPATASTATGPLPATDSTTTVALITGDQVTVRPSTQQETIKPATRNTTFQTYTGPGGDHFVVPSAAQPYLGRQLDPNLFDVTALIRDGIGTSGRVPIRLAFAAGVVPTAPPGVIITSVSGGAAAGYVTATSGAAFATALRKQIGTDIAAGHPAGTTPLSGGLTGVSLAATGPATNTAQPRFPLGILHITGTDLTGKPTGEADAILINTDSAGRTEADTAIPMVDGVARVAVPGGNYSLFGYFIDYDTSGNPIASRMVTVADFTVAASGTTTESLDERTATSAVSVSTPRPAAQDVAVTNFRRIDAAGIPVDVGNYSIGDAPIFVNAQPAAKIGSLRYFVEWGGQPTTEPSDPYRYDVAFGLNNIPANEAFVARPNQLATTATAATTPSYRNACPAATPGQAQCFAEIRTDTHGAMGVRGAAAYAALPDGYGPADLASAYDLPSTGGSGQTVGIVDAGDDANAEADLAVYRATFGLPACTTANGCFRKVNQSGATAPLPPDQSWGDEISLDLDMVSAACPGCHIVLVEADDGDIGNLAAAENTAVAAGANEVSNSYGLREYNGMQAFASAYRHPGVAILASTGDYGYSIPAFPAVLPSVVAVGGTRLSRAANARGWTETAWQFASSGCSAWLDKPSWQTDPNCPGRMTADIAADADPDTGPAVYDSHDGYGWTVIGGTSAASPFLAGVIGLAGNPQRYPDASYFYAHTGSLNDVTSGSNLGYVDCGGDYQCDAVPGYDGPTGNGTPAGLAAF